MSTLLYCADPLSARRVDAHFAPEAARARDLGGRIALLDHDALLAGNAQEAISRVPADSGTVWYRGWMIPPERYADLDAALRQRGAALATSPELYRRAHELPGWYSVFAPATPPSAWLACPPRQAPEADALARLASRLPPGPGIVKDYVKSRKHEWDTACYIPDLCDTGVLHRIVSRFIELQDDFLTGGIVLRAFEAFDTAAGEARVWWLDGAPVHVGAHPDSPNLSPDPDIAEVAPLVTALGARFVTTDLARREAGTWRVVEVGDGQVSGLPEGAAPGPILTAMLKAPDQPES